MEMDKMNEMRKRRLEELIADRFDGIRAKFCEASGEDQTYIARIYSDDIKHKKSFTEKRARKIEDALKLPPYWLDQNEQPSFNLPPDFDPDKHLHVTDDEFVEIEMLSNELGAGNGAILHDYDLVNGKLAYRRDWIAKRGLVAANLRVLPVKGNSMIPYLFDGNKAVINTAAKRIVDGEHYAIRVGDQAKVKRLFKQPDGKIRVESYNAVTEYIGPGDDAEVLGHVVDRKGA